MQKIFLLSTVLFFLLSCKKENKESNIINIQHGQLDSIVFYEDSTYEYLGSDTVPHLGYLTSWPPIKIRPENYLDLYGCSYISGPCKDPDYIVRNDSSFLYIYASIVGGDFTPVLQVISTHNTITSIISGYLRVGYSSTRAINQFIYRNNVLDSIYAYIDHANYPYAIDSFSYFTIFNSEGDIAAIQQKNAPGRLDITYEDTISSEGALINTVLLNGILSQPPNSSYNYSSAGFPIRESIAYTGLGLSFGNNSRRIKEVSYSSTLSTVKAKFYYTYNSNQQLQSIFIKYLDILQRVNRGEHFTFYYN